MLFSVLGRVNLRRDHFGPYLVAAGCVALALAAQWTFSFYLASAAPFFLCFPAILVAFWLGGVRSGIIAVTLSLVAANYAISPELLLHHSAVNTFTRGLLFALLSACMISFTEVLRRSYGEIEASLRAFRSETERRKSAEERLELARKLAKVVVFIRDLEEEKYSTFGPLHEVFGASVGTRTALFETVLPADRSGLEEKVAEAIRECGNINAEYRIVKPDGGIRWLASIGRVLQKENHPCTQVAGITFDITERKLAEQQLIVSENRFRQLAEAIPAVVWTAAGNGRFDYGNGKWYEMFGTWGNDVAQYQQSKMHPDDQEHWADSWSKAQERKQLLEIEYRLWDYRVNQYRWFLSRTIPMLNADGSINRWFGTVTDIHSQREASALLEAEVHRRASQLEQSNDALRQFAYAAAHDLKEPLRNVALCSQLLSRNYKQHLDAEGFRLVTANVEGAHRVHSMIDSLLAFASVTDKAVSAPTSINAEEAISVVLHNLEPSIRETNAEIRYDSLPAICIHEIHLIQLFQNLISNSLKYRRPGQAPEVEIRGQQHETDVEFSVRDNGIGFDPAFKEIIFGLFKRLHQRDQYSGTGFGLAICARIIKAYHGRIWADSKPNCGSTFFFSVPN